MFMKIQGFCAEKIVRNRCGYATITAFSQYRDWLYVATPSYFSYCDEESPTLSGFSIRRDQEYIIPALKAALAINPEIQIIATPWSAPAWMKTNHDLKGVTEAAKAGGATCRLRPESFALYADYFVKFIEAYRDAGIAIYGVTPQNEPQNDGSDYPCMRMDEADQIRFIALLGPPLKERKLATRIFVHDHNWTLHPNDRKVVGGDAKMDPAMSAQKILADRAHPTTSPGAPGRLYREASSREFVAQIWFR